MYAYLKGTLAATPPGQAIVDVNGIGFLLHTPGNLPLPAIGEPLTLHTTQVVRENEISLYGFKSAEQRDLFETLTAVSGVGPKLALALLGTLSATELHRAIAEGDVKLLSSVSGIGRRTAERLTVDLRGKLQLPLDMGGPSLTDALSALMNLGYSRQAAQRALEATRKSLPEGTPLPELITAALQHISM
jgi:holliday junction DNA helicase RuvA